ncbi:MAG: hypothetical protein HY330_03195 [Chloroflexi bacterium]|nr:hypothetical protein [Chloroflexota bacterium]
MPEPQTHCHVCSDALDPEHIARCAVCFRQFHQKWNIHAQVPDCGRPFINPETCTMGFVCRPCDERLAAEAEQATLQQQQRLNPPQR